MAEKVTFDGAEKLIIVNDGETSLDAQRDIYSAWKRWMISPETGPTGLNSRWLQALRTIGGDIITAESVVSPYFFLTNGWRLRPYEGDHQLIVDGNLFVDGGGNPFVTTTGNYNVLINLNTSSKSITTTLEVSTGSGLSQAEHDQLFDLPTDAIIADAVWDEMLAQHIVTGSAGQIIDKIKKLVALIPGTV